MFWNENELTKKRGARILLPPPIPDTNWIKPTEPPNLSSASVISFDTETKDLTLNTEGPGWARGKAHVVGVSLAAMDRLGNRGSWYFPIRHEIEPYDNLDPKAVLPWLDTVLNTPHVEKVGANLTYDIGNLAAEGVRVAGRLNDVQFAEPLIDQDAFISLEHLARKYLGVGKVSDVVKEWCQKAYPHTAERYWRSDLYRTPPRLVAPYAIGDADLPIDIFLQQWPLLEMERLDTVYRLECDLIPLMIAMRFQGITVDVNRAEQLITELNEDIRVLYKRIYVEYGYNIQSTSSANLGALFTHIELPFNRTEAGNPSFTKEFLAALTHPVGALINDIREHEKMISTFLKGYVLDMNINGKLHPQFHQLKGDENGTTVGRFSSSDPNLQNIPARSDLGKKIRSCFIKHHGHYKWHKYDQSQVHYRILAHFAVGPGADDLRQKYINDPATDYHQTVYDSTAPLMNWSLTDKEFIKKKRRIIKNINFSGLYGVGLETIKYKYLIGMSEDEVKEFMANYYKAAPYIKPTTEAIGREVQQFGFVTTLLGRRIRFNEYEPVTRERGVKHQPMPYHQAMAVYGPPLKRAYEYRGVNYKFQGSEPDIIKSGLLDCWNAGVFDVTGVPVATVHDENDWSLPDNSPIMTEALKFIREVMISSLPRRTPFRVPLKVDAEQGDSWGTVEDVTIE